MTVVDFYLNIESSIYPGEKEVAVTAANGDMKSEFNVSLPDFEDGLSDISHYLFDWIMQQLESRAWNANDDDLITDEELETFRKVMKVIEW